MKMPYVSASSCVAAVILAVCVASPARADDKILEWKATQVAVGSATHLEVFVTTTVKGRAKRVRYECASKEIYDAISRVAGTSRRMVVAVSPGNPPVIRGVTF